MPRTGENIYKRKDGRWEARIIVEYDPNGKAKYKYLYAKTYSEVKAKMIRVHSSIESSTTIITNKEASYESWLIRWLRSKKVQVKSSTYIRYRNIIRFARQKDKKTIYRPIRLGSENSCRYSCQSAVYGLYGKLYDHYDQLQGT